MSEDKDELTGHDYDGIQEYDNPLPSWWLATFFATIIFSFIYWIHYEFAGGQGQLAELAGDLAMVQKASEKAAADNPGDNEELLAQLIKDKNAVQQGKEVYQAKCAACHGNELQGLIGPNLVDEYWIYGQGRMVEMIQVVRKGVLDKGMPAWETMLKDGEIKSVIAFVVSMRGTKPNNAKAPQGEKIVNGQSP